MSETTQELHISKQSGTFLKSEDAFTQSLLSIAYKEYIMGKMKMTATSTNCGGEGT